MEKSLFSNAVKFAVASASQIFLFALLILAGRILCASYFGKFSFSMAFAFMFKPLIDPGLDMYLIREIARERENTHEFLSHAAGWLVLIAPVVCLLIYVVVNVIESSPATLYAVYLMGFSLYLKFVKQVHRSALVGWEYMGLDAFSLALERILLFGFGAW